jgi:hypothetical protein
MHCHKPICGKERAILIFLPNGRHKRMIGLHQKYGPIVRSTARSLTISDKNMIKQILHDDDLPKARIYKNLQCTILDFISGKHFESSSIL